MSRNRPNKILIPQEFFLTCKFKHLLLDTCFFIDAAISKDEFLRFRELCEVHSITLVTVDPVVAEFTTGADNKETLKDKLSLIDDFVDYYLPTTPDIISQYVPRLIEDYGSFGKGVSYTDYLLGAFSLKHHNDLCVLTKNATDFPGRIFDLQSYFILSGERHLHVYGSYCAKKNEKAR